MSCFTLTMAGRGFVGGLLLVLAAIATPAKIARAQGLGIPGVGGAAPMMRPPQRPSPQAAAGGAPGQLNSRISSPSPRPGQSMARPTPTMMPQGRIGNVGKAGGSLGPIGNSSQMSRVSSGVIRSADQMKRLNSGGGLIVNGYGPVMRSR